MRPLGDWPVFEDDLCACNLNLLAEALVIESHERIMTLVGRTADRVRRDDDPVSEVNRINDCRQDADVRLCPAHNECRTMPFSQEILKSAVGKRRVPRLI